MNNRNKEDRHGNKRDGLNLCKLSLCGNNEEKDRPSARDVERREYSIRCKCFYTWCFAHRSFVTSVPRSNRLSLAYKRACRLVSFDYRTHVAIATEFKLVHRLGAKKKDFREGNPSFLVEAAGLEPTVSSTRNWRDTTFATPRKRWICRQQILLNCFLSIGT